MRKGFGIPLAIAVVAVIVGIAAAVLLLPHGATVAGADQVKKFSSCSQVQSFLEENTGAGYSSGFGAMRNLAAAAPMAALEQKSTGESDSSYGAGTTDFSMTNIQVEGVDEADIVKSDGKYLYVVSGGRVLIVDAYPPEGAKIVSEINVSGYTSEIYVNGDRLVIFASGYRYYTGSSLKVAALDEYAPWGGGYGSSIIVYDITDRAAPVVKRNITLDGSYYDSRMIDDYVYVISTKSVSSWDQIGIPNMIAGGVARPVCGCSDIYYFDVPDSSYQFTTVTSLDVKDDMKEPNSKVFLLGYSQSLYVSSSNIYITYQKRMSEKELLERMITQVLIPSLPTEIAARVSEAWNSDNFYQDKMEMTSTIFMEYMNSLGPEQAAAFQKNVETRVLEFYQIISKEMERSSVHRISIANGDIQYGAGGSVPGTPLNQFSMDEYGGYFRIATTTGGSWKYGIQSNSSNHVYVLDMSLNIVGRLEDLAEGESIYSTRFIGNRLYMVTFVRIDPLFVIDLSDPTQPKVLGELKIPGFSDYLHPYDENHIIGIGMDTENNEWGGIISTSGIKVSLFDVTDVTRPVEMSKYTIGGRGSYSYALNDHKAFLFNKDKQLLVIPATINDVRFDGKGSKYHDGSQVFRINLEEGVVFRGEVTHTDPKPENVTYYYPRYDQSVKRSLYIGEALYTVSDSLLKISSLADLSEIKNITLQEQNGEPLYRVMAE
jgi:inhibitor of cysteine peptidase